MTAEAALVQGLLRGLLRNYFPVHDLFNTGDVVDEGMIHGVRHQVFNCIRLLAP